MSSDPADGGGVDRFPGDADRVSWSLEEGGPVALAGVLVVAYLATFQWTATRLYLLNFTTAGPNATAVLLFLFVTGWIVAVVGYLDPRPVALYGGGVAVVAGGAVAGLAGNPFLAGLGGVAAMTAATAVLAGLLAVGPGRTVVGVAAGVVLFQAAGIWHATAPPYATAGATLTLGVVLLAGAAVTALCSARGALSTPDWSAPGVSLAPLAAFLFAEGVWLGSPHVVARWTLGPYPLAAVAAVAGLVAGVALVASGRVPGGRVLVGWAAVLLAAVSGLLVLDHPASGALAAPAQAAAVVVLAGGSRPGASRGLARTTAGIVGVQLLGAVLVFLYVSAANWAYMPGPLPALTRGLGPHVLLALFALLPATALAAGIDDDGTGAGAVDRPRRAILGAAAVGGLGLAGLVPGLEAPLSGGTDRDGGVRDGGSGPSGYRVLTYNVHQYLDGTDAGRYNLAEVAAVVDRTDPDLLGLQESEGATVTSGNVDGVRWLARRLGYHAVSGAETRTGTYGVALLSRWPIEDVSVFELPVGRSIVRPTLAATVRSPEGPLRVVVTHFEVDKPEDRHPAAARRVLDAVPEDRPAVLLGDFNLTPADPTYDRLAGPLTDAWAAANGVDGGETFPAGDPEERIDYVWLAGDWTVESARTVGTAAVSDHLGVLTVASPGDPR